MTIPMPIETERLLIRPFEAEDADAMTNVYGDPEVMRHVCIGVLDRDRTVALLEEYRPRTLGVDVEALVAEFATYREFLVAVDRPHRLVERMRIPRLR